MKTPGIVAFAFGTPGTIQSNRRIAEIASKKARELKCRVFTQLDIIIESGIEVTYINQEPNNPPPTLRIARRAVQWAVIHGLTDLWIIAAKPHVWRATRDIEQTVYERGIWIKIHVSREIEQYPEESWFCSDSTQERARSRKAWNKRERILKLMPFFIYKRVAN